MFKPLSVCIGLRYTRAKRRTGFISFITLTSILGTALGVTALITVLSVMNGFEADLHERILGRTAHATISSRHGSLENWQTLKPILSEIPEIRGMAPFVEGQAMLSSVQQVSGIMLQGISPEYEPEVSDFGQSMLRGHLDDLKPGEYGIVLGADLAAYLRVNVGDRITMISPQLNSTPAGVLPRLRRFTVVGLFSLGVYEFDRNVALIHIEDAAKLQRLGEGVSGIRLKLDNLLDAPRVTHEIARKLSSRFLIRDWTQANSNFFQAIKTEKRVMFIILTLIVAVAAFNIVSTLVMLVTDKRSDIAILKTQGMTPGTIMRVFMVTGTFIGAAGTLLGVIGGIALALNVETIVPALESFFNIRFMPSDVYQVSSLPSLLVWSDVWRIAGMAFILSLLAAIYPAWQASKVHPAEELRYE